MKLPRDLPGNDLSPSSPRNAKKDLTERGFSNPLF